MAAGSRPWCWLSLVLPPSLPIPLNLCLSGTVRLFLEIVIGNGIWVLHSTHPKTSYHQSFWSLLPKWSNPTGGLGHLWECQRQGDTRSPLSIHQHMKSPATLLPFSHWSHMHKSSVLASCRGEGREEVGRRKDKYGSPSIPSSLSLRMWPHLWESESREVRGSAAQGQSHPHRGLQGSAQHCCYQSCTRNADIVGYFAPQHYKVVCAFCIATPRQVSCMEWMRLQILLCFLSVLNKTVNSRWK